MMPIVINLLIWVHLIALALGFAGGIGMSQVGPRLAAAAPDQRATWWPMASSPRALCLLPGPPRELQPMFRKFAMPILKSIVEVPLPVERRSYSIAGVGESLVEKAIGEKAAAGLFVRRAA